MESTSLTLIPLCSSFDVGEVNFGLSYVAVPTLGMAQQDPTTQGPDHPVFRCAGALVQPYMPSAPPLPLPDPKLPWTSQPSYPHMFAMAGSTSLYPDALPVTTNFSGPHAAPDIPIIHAPRPVYPISLDKLSRGILGYPASPASPPPVETLDAPHPYQPALEKPRSSWYQMMEQTHTEATSLTRTSGDQMLARGAIDDYPLACAMIKEYLNNLTSRRRSRSLRTRRAELARKIKQRSRGVGAHMAHPAKPLTKVSKGRLRRA
ncbi:hypothetical protein C8T65DRAFT_643787 [Cerioporus squamosus]|nr:hypothetical protein C8T65DRAFT_643787 [Cerioporus squamosus]